MNIYPTATKGATSERQLEHLIKLMTSIIPIAYIFKCEPHPWGIRLIIVLDRYRYQPADETKNILEFLALSRASIEMMYHDYGTMHDILQRGNLFFAQYCRRHYCIYQNSPDDELFKATDANLYALQATHTLIIKSGVAQISSFMDGAMAYFNLGRFNLSAFMLHQACEQMFRVIIKLGKGKEFKSHQLVLLRKTAGFYYPEIKNIFDAKVSKELKWLELLQQAYIGARYDDQYKIEPEFLAFIHRKISAMLNQINVENIFAPLKNDLNDFPPFDYQ